jgi:hypothetical protein
MKGLFVSFAFMAALMFGSIAHAESKLSMEGLSETAQAELALQAAQLRKDALKTPIVIPDIAEMEKYVGVGEQIGKAFAVTARELGIEVNNFATSPVGMIAIFLIVWHFFGAMIVHLVFGGAWFLTMVPLWVYFFKRLAMGREEKYDSDGKRVSITYAMDASSDTVVTFVITGAVIMFVGIIGIFSF